MCSDWYHHEMNGIIFMLLVFNLIYDRPVYSMRFLTGGRHKINKIRRKKKTWNFLAWRFDKRTPTKLNSIGTSFFWFILRLYFDATRLTQTIQLGKNINVPERASSTCFNAHKSKCCLKFTWINYVIFYFSIDLGCIICSFPNVSYRNGWSTKQF